MDLKMKDVAQLLNLSEATISDLVKEGKIPGYLLNDEYRFSRLEIENWMLGDKLHKQLYPTQTAKSGNLHFSLYRAIHHGGIFNEMAGTSKEELIRNTVKSISGKLNLDAEIVTELLLDREEMMPTALNHGIGVPHARDVLLKLPYDVVAIVFPKEPIDYGALDGQLVHTLFFLFASSDKMHLHLLAKIAHLSHNHDMLKMLQTRPDKSILLDAVKAWEPQLKH